MSEQVQILQTEILSSNRYSLKKIIYNYLRRNGTQLSITREVFDRGNGAVILLFNKENKTVVLTRQFRLPTYLNGNKDGMLIEACAGTLDENENAEDCIRRETEEETGYTINKIEKVFEAYMSPGSVTEILHFFIAEYSNTMKTAEGGGIDTEDIEVLELPFDKALQMVTTGEIKDAKTILLLQHLKVHAIL